MQLITLVAASLLFFSVTATPIPVCEHVLSFSNSAEFSIAKLRTICTKQQSHSLQNAHAKRSLESGALLEPPLTDSTALSQASATTLQELIESLDEVKADFPRNSQQLLSAGDSSPRPLPRQDPFYWSLLQIIRSKKQELAQPYDYQVARDYLDLDEFLQRTHGLLLTVMPMSEDLAISGAIAVLFVLAVLLTADRWLHAKRRHAQDGLASTTPADLQTQAQPALLLSGSGDKALLITIAQNV